MKIIAFSDIHGSIEALTMATEYIERATNVDAIIVAGDFSSFNYEPTEAGHQQEEHKIREMFNILESL